jgi:mono/diheme cytochrome c family protein
MSGKQWVSVALAAALLALPAWLAMPVRAQTSDATGLVNTRDFSHANGAQVYATICQGCHMPAGQGARGAGEYPALAANPKLAAAPYVEMMVLTGNGAMPGFQGQLSDRQIAEVTTYIRTHFGNQYDAPVTDEEVKALRTTLAGRTVASDD